ncbi:acyl-[acyl-carrier-protein] thioesterase [Tannockella kyphosi]|uniref:acyl-[acyl-carrier-protein] thioesterase n=1 Tax=Tannockella kyphosi TaxID=2899121 RepID=UPI002011F15B|nr:acyl-ACP thioesterase domain-containing protein [Tannockella kyphosi]
MKYAQEFTITFRDVDCNGDVRIDSFIDFMQEIARSAAINMHVDFETPNINYYWVIIRNYIHIKQYPKIGDTIKIVTNHAGLDKMYAVREFHIYDMEDNHIGSITGYYLLMEQGKNRPVRIKGNELFQNLDFPYQGQIVDKLQTVVSTVKEVVERKVFSSYIDGNGHMNNACYIQWALDMYQRAELDTRKIKSLQIQYVKELLEDDSVTITRYENDYIIGQKDGTVSFMVQITFIS